MLQNTFAHIPGIGLKTEKALWDMGILSWDDFDTQKQIQLSLGKSGLIAHYLEESRLALQNQNPSYFVAQLAAKNQWRIFDTFRDNVAYLDIETNGMSFDYGYITTIAVYDGLDIRYYVKDINLDQFKYDIDKYKVLITYNGKVFDIPYIENHLNIKLPQAHIDLRYVLASLGYKGGLKKCETAMGIDRGDLNGVDGFFAILLWNDYLAHKNPKTLETLLAYNIEDVVNLETLMVLAYNQCIRNTPFAVSHEIELPKPPDLPFKPDSKTIERIKANAMYY